MKTDTLTPVDALAQIAERLGGNLTQPHSILEMERRRDHNTTSIIHGLEKLNEAFKILCRDNPNLLEMINLCRAKLNEDPYSSYFGENPMNALTGSLRSDERIVILYRFGYSNVSQTLSLAVLPNDRIALVTNTDVPVMQFFYHRLAQMSELHPASYNAPLAVWLEQLTNTGSSGREEFLHVLYHCIRQILSVPKQ